jgi:tetratricopeptide (TPR) repeat protein
VRLPERYHLDGQGASTESPIGLQVTARDGERRVVVEVLRPELAADPRRAALHRWSVTRCLGVSHRCLLPIHDVGLTPDGLPYVANPAPEAIVNELREPPAWSELGAWLDQLLEALAHLHARGFVHGALAPDRMWLHRDGRGSPRELWLVDPGRANVPNVLGLRSIHPRYLAPEQLLDRTNEVLPATDLYAVGVVAWELLTGRSPYTGRTSPLDTELPPYVPRLTAPPKLETVLANLLRADPMSRYDLAADVRTELHAAVHATSSRRPTRDGTVAPGASVRASADPVADLDEVVMEPVLDEGPGATPPRWNRPYPPPITEHPPEPPEADWVPAHPGILILRETELYGRDQACRTLWDAARKVAELSRPQIVVIAGPRGSGRTAVVQWLVRCLEERGTAESVWVKYGDPPTGGDGTAGSALALLEPWGDSRQSLQSRIRRRLHRESGPDTAGPGTRGGGRGWARADADAAALAAWCGLRDPDEPPAAAGVGMAEVVRHVEARTWRGLSVLVVEDVDNAPVGDDTEGLALAELYGRRLADDAPPPVLVVATVDSGAFEDRPSLEERIAALQGLGALRIDLTPLTGTETADLARELLPLADAPAEQLGFHHQGLPGVVRQALLDWVERDWLVEDPEHGALTVLPREDTDPDGDQALASASKVASRAVPEDLQSVVRRRIAGLARRAAAATGAPEAGHGKRFVDLVHLTALAGRTPRPIFEGFAGADLVPMALASRVWTEHPDGLVVTEGAVARVGAADAAARPDHVYLHRRLGRAFGRLADELAGISGALEAGVHAVAGEDATFGVPWLLRAAERAASTGRSADLWRAAKLAHDAIANDPALASFQPVVLLWMARAHEARGEWTEAGERFTRAAEALASGGELPMALDAVLGLAWTRMRAHDASGADARFTEVLSHAREHQLVHHEARAIAGKAAVELREGRMDEAEQGFARALARCTELGQPRGVGEALDGQARVARSFGRFDDAEALFHGAIDAFRRGRDPLGSIRSRLGLAANRWQRTPDDLAHRMCVWCADRAGAFGAVALEIEARLSVADLARLRGDLRRAQRGYDACAEWADRTDAIDAGIASSLGLARLALQQGALTAAYDHTRRAADWLGREPGHPLWGAYRLVVATLVARRGDHTQTWQWLWSTQEAGAVNAIDRDTAACLVMICDAAAEAGWGNVMKLAGKLGLEQLERLGDEAGATRLKHRVSSALI